MDLTHINAQAWQEFEKKFPTAHFFLLRASLEGEARVLICEMAQSRNIHRLNWIAARLDELERAGIISHVRDGIITDKEKESNHATRE